MSTIRLRIQFIGTGLHTQPAWRLAAEIRGHQTTMAFRKPVTLLIDGKVKITDRIEEVSVRCDDPMLGMKLLQYGEPEVTFEVELSGADSERTCQAILDAIATVPDLQGSTVEKFV